jgi:hypothetical protein
MLFAGLLPSAVSDNSRLFSSKTGIFHCLMVRPRACLPQKELPTGRLPGTCDVSSGNDIKIKRGNTNIEPAQFNGQKKEEQKRPK